ncbi:MAG: glycerol kinase, partial [Polyangiaceae bacterium]
ADVADVTVERPADLESTGRGAAMLAGIGAGLFTRLDDVARMSPVASRFEAHMDATERQAHLRRWDAAVARTTSTTSTT